MEQLLGSLASVIKWCNQEPPSHLERTGLMSSSQPCLNIYIKSAKFYTSLLLEFCALEIQAASEALGIIASWL